MSAGLNLDPPPGDGSAAPEELRGPLGPADPAGHAVSEPADRDRGAQETQLHPGPGTCPCPAPSHTAPPPPPITRVSNVLFTFQRGGWGGDMCCVCVCVCASVEGSVVTSACCTVKPNMIDSSAMTAVTQCLTAYLVSLHSYNVFRCYVMLLSHYTVLFCVWCL